MHPSSLYTRFYTTNYKTLIHSIYPLKDYFKRFSSKKKNIKMTKCHVYAQFETMLYVIFLCHLSHLTGKHASVTHFSGLDS